MTKKLSSEEIAILIKAQQISKEKGIPPGVNISEICKIGEISRKTGYKYLNGIDKTEKESRET